MERCEDIRQTIGMKDVYSHRKETIEQPITQDGKRKPGFRYTQMYGKARMKMSRAYLCCHES